MHYVVFVVFYDVAAALVIIVVTFWSCSYCLCCLVVAIRDDCSDVGVHCYIARVWRLHDTGVGREEPVSISGN